MNLGLGLFLGSRGAGFDPSKLANVAHWYRADLGITLATGVSQWRDQIGIAHLLQGTGASQPLYTIQNAAYNNQPTVTSTVAGQRLLAASVATAQPLAIWVVGDCQTDNAVLVTLGASSATPPRIFRQSGNLLTAGAGANISAGVGFDTKRAVLFTANGASSFLGVNNWLTGGVTAGGGSVNGTDITAFAFSSGDFGCTGNIAEIIIAAPPTSQEKTNMAAYFLARYGITVT